MRITQSILLSLLLSAFAIAAPAQTDTTEDAAPAADEAPAAETNEAPAASSETDTDADAAPAEPKSEEAAPAETVEAVHGDWQIRCRSDNNGCFMYQLAIDARDVPIAEMSIVPLQAEDGRVAGFTVVTPLRTLLPEGVALQIDNGRVQKYQFGWCTEAGCASRFAVREDGLNLFKRGNKVRLTVRSVEKPDAPVVLDVSLKGFTAAFNDLTGR